MHQNRSELEVRPRPCWGSLERPRRPPAVFKGTYFQGEGGGRWRGKGKGSKEEEKRRERRGRSQPPSPKYFGLELPCGARQDAQTGVARSRSLLRFVVGRRCRCTAPAAGSRPSCQVLYARALLLTSSQSNGRVCVRV